MFVVNVRRVCRQCVEIGEQISVYPTMNFQSPFVCFSNCECEWIE